jgi:PhnB protein
MIISAVPKGYTTVTPYLVVKSPLALFQFLQHAFGAEEVRRSPLPNGGAFNIEVKIGDAMVMLVLARQDHDERAILAGGKSLLQPEDQFYGDRCAGIQDSEGNNWWIGQRIEDLTSDEIGERIKALG